VYSKQFSWRRALALGLSAILCATGLAVIAPARPANADPSCMVSGGIYVLFARGSDEHFDDKRAIAFKTSILSLLQNYGVSRAWAEVGNLDGDFIVQSAKGEYPAVPWQDYVWPQMTGYLSSVWTGVSELTKHIKDRVARCPRESIVLGGYSQGAEVVGTALNGLTDSVLSHIGFAALYGDPRATGCHASWSRGSANCASGQQGQRNPYVPAALDGRLGSWCDAHDGICTGNRLYLPIAGNSLSTHGTAYDGKWISDSGWEIVHKAITKLNQLNGTSVPAPSYSITPPGSADPAFPTIDNTRIALPSGQQYVWQRGVTIPISYSDAQRYDAEGNPLQSSNLNWNGPMNTVSLPPNTVIRPVGVNQQYLWSSGGQKLPIGDPATSACYMFSFPTSNPTGQPAVVPADWASTLPTGAQGQCSLGDGIRFTQSDAGPQQYISIRGAALPVSYGDAQAYDSEGDLYHPLTLPAGYVNNPIHASVPPNTVLRTAGGTEQFLWDGNLLHTIQNPGLSACLLLAYPQNGVAIMPPSWMYNRAQGAPAQCNLGDGVRFTESAYSGLQQYISLRGGVFPLGTDDAVAYDQAGNTNVIDMPTGYVEVHSPSLPVNTILRGTGSNAQYLWDGTRLHYVPNPSTSACLLVDHPQNGVAVVPSSWEASLPVGANQSCNFEGKQLQSPTGQVDYVQNGARYHVLNWAIVNCLKGRSGAGDPIVVDQSTFDGYTDSGVNAYCPYEKEAGLNFVQEQGSPIVWLVGPATGSTTGVKRHAGSLCVNDPYTTQIKAAHVFTVPAGETAGHVQGADWWADGPKCQTLPQG